VDPFYLQEEEKVKTQDYHCVLELAPARKKEP
jgi:hypothetical protein